MAVMGRNKRVESGAALRKLFRANRLPLCPSGKLGAFKRKVEDYGEEIGRLYGICASLLLRQAGLRADLYG